jgi:hypothetical protein
VCVCVRVVVVVVVERVVFLYDVAPCLRNTRSPADTHTHTHTQLPTVECRVGLCSTPHIKLDHHMGCSKHKVVTMPTVRSVVGRPRAQCVHVHSATLSDRPLVAAPHHTTH